MPLSRVSWIFDEIALRIGLDEASRAVGITDTGYRNLLRRRQRHVGKRIVAAALIVLQDLRQRNVYTYRRGRPLTVRVWSDDLDTFVNVKTRRIDDYDRQHGTDGTYRIGCRCYECVVAELLRMRHHRHGLR